MTVSGGANGTVPIRASNADIVKDLASQKLYAYVDFDPQDTTTDTITLRLASSFISSDQAETTLSREIGNRTFDDVMAESKSIVRGQNTRSQHGIGRPTSLTPTHPSCLLFPSRLSFPPCLSPPP